MSIAAPSTPSRNAVNIACSRRPSPARHSATVDVHHLRRHRLIGRRPERLRLEAFDTRLIMLLDLLEAPLDRLLAQLIKASPAHRRYSRTRFQGLMEERQPVLHAADNAAPHSPPDRADHPPSPRQTPPHISDETAASPRRRAHTQLTGIKMSFWTSLRVRCVSGSNALIDSSVSPKKSSRTGD